MYYQHLDSVYFVMFTLNFLVLALFQSRSFSQPHSVITFVSLGYVFSLASLWKQKFTFLITCLEFRN